MTNPLKGTYQIGYTYNGKPIELCETAKLLNGVNRIIFIEHVNNCKQCKKPITCQHHS